MHSFDNLAQFSFFSAGGTIFLQLSWDVSYSQPDAGSTGDDLINCSGIIFLFPILAIMFGMSLQFFRHLEHQNPSIISYSTGIIDGCKNNGKSEESYSFRRGYNSN